MMLFQKLFHPIMFFKVIAVLKSLQLCMILSPTQPKSLYISRALNYFYETEIKTYGQLGNLEVKHLQMHLVLGSCLFLGLAKISLSQIRST